MMNKDHLIIEEYIEFVGARDFPCVAAKAAVDKQQVKCLVATHMACPHDDLKILEFLYDFVDDYRRSQAFFHSASIIFKGPDSLNAELFDALLFQRLQALANLDAKRYDYDNRVSKDPSSAHFSFSLKEEAFFIIGLHPVNNRPARRFKYPTLAFNPHAQFEHLRATSRYVKMQNIVRKRDLAFSGSINPMLKDFGSSSEAFQYSGRMYDENWQCPLNFNHGHTEDNPST